METGECAIMLAAQRRRSDALKILLAHRANPNHRVPMGPLRPDGFRTPIYDAVYFDSPENMRILIKAGADINAHDSDGLTPLTFAASFGQFDAALILLEAGADFRVAQPEHPMYKEKSRTAADMILLHMVLLMTQRSSESAEYRARKETGAKCVRFLRDKGVDFGKSNSLWLKRQELLADIVNADGKLTPADTTLLGLPYPAYHADDVL